MGCASAPAPKRTLPEDPVFNTIHARLGDPDRITGSGRSFVHYDLANGQTLTLTVSGDRIIGAMVSDKTSSQKP
jgi:hypothetical protein